MNIFLVSKKAKVPVPYKIQFKVENIHIIRRSDARLAWSYVVFIMKDKRTEPALHFHNGGIQEMISCLQRYIWLTRYLKKTLTTL